MRSCLTQVATWTAMSAVAIGALVLQAALDGAPSESDAAIAVAQDLQAALAQAQAQQPDLWTNQERERAVLAVHLAAQHVAAEEMEP